MHDLFLHYTQVSFLHFVCIYIPYSGFFQGGKFSRIALIQFFEEENFHESHQEHTVPNAFSKYFEGKIFTNGYRFVKFMKIFPLKKTPLYGIQIKQSYD